MLTYQLTGTLSDGGVLVGSFQIDTDQPDENGSSGLGTFSLSDLVIQLTDTTVFMSGNDIATRGFATGGEVFQNEFADTQFLSLDFTSDTGLSGAFAGITFEPFLGDADVFEGIQVDSFSSGIVDGSGQVDLVDFGLVLVPEPLQSPLWLFGILFLIRKRAA